MRSVLTLLFACSLVVLPIACVEKKIIVDGAPAPAAPAPDETEVEDAGAPTTPESDPLNIDLGEVQTGSEVSFEIPKGALGFNITAEGDMKDFDPNRPFGIQRITDPNGKVVHDSFTPKGGSRETSFATFDSIASASVPQGEGVSTALAGTWKVRFGVLGSASKKTNLHGRVRVQSSGDGEFHGGKLDLHVHVPEGLVVDGVAIDPAKAEANRGIKDRLDTFFLLTSELLGIDRGEVVFSEEPRSLSALDGVTAVLDGFSVSRGEKDGTQVFHVLFTNSISQDGQPIAAGIAPGIPGAASVFGRNVSGIIVTTFRSADDDAKTMLHEMGHFFGLNHTTELDGLSSDPLSDTPICEGISQDELFGCPDRSNIMFVSSALEGAPTLSVKQRRVYRGSPIYKAISTGASKTMAFAPKKPLPSSKPVFRISGSDRLSAVERELSAGSCGLTKIEPWLLVKRHGEANAIAQLRAAAADQDLAPFIRGRASLALKQLGVE